MEPITLLVKESHGTDRTEEGLLLTMLPLVNIFVVVCCKFFGADRTGEDFSFPKVGFLLVSGEGALVLEGLSTRVTDEGSGCGMDTEV
jgi:hypothetical protein